MALETAKSGVTVNAVCPGFTETDLLEGSIDHIITAPDGTVAEHNSYRYRQQSVQGNSQ